MLVIKHSAMNLQCNARLTISKNQIHPALSGMMSVACETECRLWRQLAMEILSGSANPNLT